MHCGRIADVTSPLPVEHRSVNSIHGVCGDVGGFRGRNVRELDVSGNALTGTIPSSYGSLASLHYLDLSDNDFDGTIPTLLMGCLTNLEYVVQ